MAQESVRRRTPVKRLFSETAEQIGTKVLGKASYQPHLQTMCCLFCNIFVILTFFFVSSGP